MDNSLESKNLQELRAIAKEMGIKSITILRKKELIDKIVELQNSSSNEKKEKVDSKPRKEFNNGDKPVVTTYGFKLKERQEEPKEELNTENRQSYRERRNNDYQSVEQKQQEVQQMIDDGNMGEGILEVMADGYGFLRTENFVTGANDVYISP